MEHRAIEHPANAGLRRYFEPDVRRDIPLVARPDEVRQPYMTLGTHPDIVERLWDELPRRVPVDCKRVFYGAPVLMHPTTAIVFGFAGGTHTYALRLPEPERAAALAAGATRVMHYPGSGGSLDLGDFGEEWVFCRWFRDEESWCLAAFELAGHPL